MGRGSAEVALLFCQAGGEGEEAGDVGSEGEEAGGVVPVVGGFQSLAGGGGAETEGPQDIGEEGEGDAGAKESEAGGPAELIQFPEEERHHESGLEGANAAAGFLDPKGAAG